MNSNIRRLLLVVLSSTSICLGSCNSSKIKINSSNANKYFRTTITEFPANYGNGNYFRFSYTTNISSGYRVDEVVSLFYQISIKYSYYSYIEASSSFSQTSESVSIYPNHFSNSGSSAFYINCKINDLIDYSFSYSISSARGIISKI